MIFSSRTTIFFLPALLLCCGAKAQLIPETSQVFSQSSASSKTDLGGGVEFGDRIGQALASGDFNGDGHLDLVIAVPYEDQGDNTESGWVHVVYGRRGGLSAEDDEIWSQAGTIEGLVEPRDESGFSVTTGDFNGDGIDDLAFGGPGEDIGSIFRAGGINVIYGSPSGLTDINNRGFNQDTTGISGESEEGDQMGYSLAAGDFNNDGFDDVAIGVPTEDIGTVEDAGTVQVLLGSASGLAAEGNFFLDRSADGMGGVATDDVFGNALAVGDFNGDQFPDLAIGAPFDSRTTDNAGTVHLIYGGVDGPDLSTNEVWGLDSPGIDLLPAQGDEFGSSFTVGDFDADGFDDLVVGLRGYQNSTGAALVLHGTNEGLASARHRLLQPGVDGFAGSPLQESRFADDLTAGDINGDGADELMVGSRDRHVGLQRSAGAVLIAYGEPGVGLVNEGSMLWDRSDLEVAGNPVSYDRFGSAVLLADFDGDGLDDAVISSPNREVANVLEAGDVVVVYNSGTLFADRLEAIGSPFKDCDDCPVMVNIPGGSFMQGSPPGEPQRNTDEGPRRMVNVPTFAISQTEVTFAQWDACVADGGCGHNPDDEGWGRGDRPVINVSWNHAQQYVTWLSNKSGQDYRLPSESEWEYATRAGTTGRFNTGACISGDQANFRASTTPATGCATGNEPQQTLPVASFDPNAFGLYDTHGNVWEWVQDCWNDNYVDGPVDGSAWMSGDCDKAMLRSGSWSNGGQFVRSASRNWQYHRDFGYEGAGFRLARSATQ
ncbi:SUMF1/EgtB/PvdO family nonheme iron enzyme [Wenzhouxiangella sp. XN201]|uniref:SUMF1/EgtB/PvdO family nonheme iron enzyme n=1 Tax=Wenzhouxiangella sp. XN201 TaxID=2710755 RepID=UPI0013C62108|nr:SUMF1/EgtB/PvdO family nonheme iron enzyme [Wenzhouxiangella sp. XN201]NEZ03085.1 SUMF1/EgtB/PvdO family nonheme iron enzyme [Wenzhouxiangella sp. XN201]